MPPKFAKYKQGQSGAFTEEYHALLGSTPWIVVKRLLRAAPSYTPDRIFNSESQTSVPVPSPSAAGLPPPLRVELSEGDVATVFSQFGEVVDVIFVRHRKTGTFLGTAFVRFEDYRSGILAADVMNSCVEKNEPVFLSSAHAAESDGRGITVERCEPSEVPPVADSKVESYAQWLGRRQRVA